MACCTRCCCCSLQAGVITVGVLGLIFPCAMLGGLLYVVGLIVKYGNKAKDMVEETTGGHDKVSSSADTFINIIMSAGIGILVVAIFINLFFIIMNSLLIHGARVKKAGYLIPWMIYTIIPIILVAAQLIYLGVQYAGSGASAADAAIVNSTTTIQTAAANIGVDEKQQKTLSEVFSCDMNEGVALVCKAAFFTDAVASIIFLIINGFIFCCVFSLRQEILHERS